jgi:two-component system, NtrC family, nitrogen regulation sensor histidine kinase NtrY
MASIRYKKMTLKQRWRSSLVTVFALWALVIWHLQGLPFSKISVQDNLVWLTWLLTLVVLYVWQGRALSSLDKEIQAINLHAESLRDSAFNLSANSHLLSELAPLAEVLAAMSNQLQQERASLYQRELLLDTVLQTSPSALVLTDEQDRVLLANPAARSLLNQGRNFQGSLFFSILANRPELSAAITQRETLVFFDDSASIWHLSTSQFQLNQRRHSLYQFKPITKEIHQEEIKAWKKLLRVISHELNNSLAPMSSLAYSGRIQAESSQQHKLADMFVSIGERCQHLNKFLQDYLVLARLPAPQRQPVNWAQLVNELQDHYEFELLGSLPESEWLFDQCQLAQLLLNCLKNAREAGATEAGTQLALVETRDYLMMELQDDAGGMSEEVLSHALVPFYTTKEKGTGIGLTLCQDIAHGHGGRLELLNRGAGLLVRIILPRM